MIYNTRCTKDPNTHEDRNVMMLQRANIRSIVIARALSSSSTTQRPDISGLLMLEVTSSL